MEATGDSVYFDALASHYDRLELLRIEGYRFCHELALDFIPYQVDKPFRVLDLGCGTGTFLRNILERYPNATCVGVDYSGEMLSCADRKLEEFSDRVTLRRRDLNDGLPRDLGIFEVVASFWSIHHLTDENKRRLFRQVREVLEPGGWFFLVDSMSARFEKGVFQKGGRRYRLRLEERLRDAGEPFSEAEHLKAIKEQVPDESPEKDRFAPLSSYVRWLEEAGFRSVDHLWHLWKDHFLIARPAA